MEPALLKETLRFYENDGVQAFVYSGELRDLSATINALSQSLFSDEESIVDGEVLQKAGFAFSPLATAKQKADDQRLLPGLHLIGRCTQKCLTAGKLIIIAKGFGTFSIAEEQDLATCPECKSKIPYEKIITLAFFDCTATLNGKREDIIVRKELTASNTALTTFETERPVLWNYLSVTTSPTPKSYFEYFFRNRFSRDYCSLL